MTDFVRLMFSLDNDSMTLVLMICGWGFLIMRSMVPMAGVAVAAFPLLVLSALASHAFLRETAYVVHLERGAGLALSTGVGMILGVIVVIVAVRVALLIHDATRSRPQLQG